MQNGPFFPQNGQFFPQNALFIHFSYEFCTFLIHSKFHSIVQQKYSFKKISDYSFKKYSFKKIYLIIHSIEISIFLSDPGVPGPIYGFKSLKQTKYTFGWT